MLLQAISQKYRNNNKNCILLLEFRGKHRKAAKCSLSVFFLAKLHILMARVRGGIVDIFIPIQGNLRSMANYYSYGSYGFWGNSRGFPTP